MPLPEQLSDIARELARRSHETSDAPTYTAGVRDTLALVGELLRLTATGLPRGGGSAVPHPGNTSERLRSMASELARIQREDLAAPSLSSLDPRLRFDLVRAQELLDAAARDLEGTRHLATVTPAAVPASVDGQATWLAAFALAVAREDGSDERDIADVVRLAGDDREVLAAAAHRVETAADIDPEQRQRARQLFARADAARSQRRTATR